MLSSLRNVSDALAGAVADGLGLELPKPMPRAIRNVPKPEVGVSTPLSLLALPGTGGIATRKVALLIANGIDGAAVSSLIGALNKAGAVTRLLSSRLGTVKSASGESFEVDATLENSPAVLFDAMILPGGPAAVGALAQDGHVLEFLKDQYRHCKTILALGTSNELLDQAGIGPTLPSGAKDPGLITESDGTRAIEQEFIRAIARHRHPERDRDPPLV
jgi:catalase